MKVLLLILSNELDELGKLVEIKSPHFKLILSHRLEDRGNKSVL